MTVPTMDPITLSDISSTPDLTRLTTRSVDGTGVFDVLMRAFKNHLIDEYDAGRIVGTEYSQVYLGSVQSILQQSVAFLLNHQQEKLTNAQIGLVRQQIVTELAKTDDTLPVGLGFNGDELVEGITAAELERITKQNLISDAQIINLGAEKELIGQKIITELVRTGDNFEAAKAAGHGFNVTDVIEGLSKAEIDRSTIQNQLTEQQIVTELGNTSTTKPIDLGVMSSTDIDGLIKAQIDKTLMENTLTEQKVVTEIGQTSLTKPLDLGVVSSTAIDGLTKAQIDSTLMENRLTEQKIVTELGQTSATKPSDLGAVGTTTIEGIIAAELSRINKQNDVSDAQISTLGSEKDLNGQRIVSELARTSEDLTDVNAQYGFNTNAVVSGLIKAEIDHAAMQNQLTEQKVVTELGQTSDIKPSDLGAVTGTSIDGLLATTKLKTQQEVTLMAQKAITELAQTADTIPTNTEALNASTSVSGTVAKQKTLFERQADGFLRDAEQKAAKMLIEAWQVDASVGDAVRHATNGLEDASLGVVISKLKQGIGAA